MTNIINGNNIAEEIITSLKKLPTPQKELHAILVGDDNASLSFLKKKSAIAQNLGVKFILHNIESTLTQEDLTSKISEINENSEVGGIIVQLPLPKKYNKDEVLRAIDTAKDVDALRYKDSPVLPPAVGALESVLKKIGFNIENKEVVIVGLGFLVGLPIKDYLEKKTINIKVIERGELKENSFINADLIITATGVPELIKGSNMKKGVVVIDFGYGKKEGKLYGDIEVDSVNKVASYITPTPGGTGPIVVAKLFENFYKLNEQS